MVNSTRDGIDQPKTCSLPPRSAASAGKKDCDDLLARSAASPDTADLYTCSSVRLGILPCLNLLFASCSMRELLPQLTQTGVFTSRSHLRFSRRKLNLRCCQLLSSVFGLALDIKCQNPEQRMSPRTTDSAQPRSARQTPLVRSSKNLFCLPLILLYC